MIIRQLTTDLHFRLLLVLILAAAQVAPAQFVPPGFNPPSSAQPPPQQPPQPAPGTPAPGTPAADAQVPTPTPPAPGTTTANLSLTNASLREVIDILARQLKISYILDPRVQGGVTINTYGETKPIDNRALLDTILRINGFALIPQGDVYRIVPLTDVLRMPGLKPEVNATTIPDDDRTMLNLLFLKYATVDEIAKLLTEFLTEPGKMITYAPANLLLIQDSRRNMRRLMDLVSLFDSDTFANQRVKLFEIKNGRPSEVAKELEGILKGISLNAKASPIQLLPVDRINTLIAVAPNPGVFKEVEEWLRKLDIAVTTTAGSVDNFVYRVKYGNATTLALAIMALYSDNPYYAISMLAMLSSQQGGVGSSNNGAYGGNVFGAGGGGGYSTGPYGNGTNIGGGGGFGAGMLGGGMFGGGMMGGGMMGGMMGGGGYGGGYGGGGYPQTGFPAPGTAGTTAGAAPGGTNLTGQYLGNQQPGAPPTTTRVPRIIPNPFDNTLLIQATRTEYEGIAKLLRDIDVAPRQVLIEAKIYEVTLGGALRSGVNAYLQNRGATRGGGLTPNLVATLADGGLGLTTGALVGQTKELLLALSASELSQNARIISAPAIIATDSVTASINVGTQVPTLTSQAITGVQQGGTSVFANSIQNRDTGVTLNVLARVNPSGVVTLVINQEVSAPVAPASGAGIQSPSFSKRNVQTQVTVQDGDTVAIAGIISENQGSEINGIPFLSRIPVFGAAFGNRSSNKARTELIVFMTPRVIYDTNSMSDATDELKSRLKKMSRYLKEEDK
ncbi:MAG: type II secretion system secretin GspD [Bryobacteraceae bacterium]|nr:type II secretion system secretin GspD [Bryobacteraceae bacterium]